MILQPKRVIYYSIVVYIIVILFGAVLLSIIIKEESVITWEKYISRYLLEKNVIIYSTFFDGFEEAEDVRGVNFYNLDGFLDFDETFEMYNLEGLIFYDISDGVIHSYNRNLDMKITDNKQILEEVLGRSYTTDIKCERESIDGKSLSIVSLPLWTSSKKHHISTIYIFGLNKFVISNFSRTMVASIATVLCLTLIVTILVIYYRFKWYINHIISHIEQNVSNPSNDINDRFHYFEPFENLELQIAFLISQRQEYKEQYNDISDRLHYLVHLTAEGIVMEDKLGLIHYCNQQFAKILDYDNESDLIGIKFIDLFVDNDEIYKYQNELEIRQAKENYAYNITLRGKNGKKVSCRLTAHVVKEVDSSIKGYYGTIKDITGTSTFSISEVENYKMRNLILDTNLNPVVLLDEKNIVVYANDAFIDFINKKRPEVMATVFDDVLRGHELEKIYLPDIYEFEFYDPSRNQWYSVTNRAIKYETKDYKYLVMYPSSDLKTKTPYHKIVFDDVRGFFFITSKDNQVLFISASFRHITKQPDAWFIEYHDSMIKASPTKTLNLFEPLILITADRKKIEFKLTQLYTNTGNFHVYLAMQK